MGMVVNIMTGSVSKAVDRKETHGHILNYPFLTAIAAEQMTVTISDVDYITPSSAKVFITTS